MILLLFVGNEMYGVDVSFSIVCVFVLCFVKIVQFIRVFKRGQASVGRHGVLKSTFIYLFVFASRNFFAAAWLRTAFFRICRRVTGGGVNRFPTFRRNVVPSSSRFQWYEKNSPGPLDPAS